MNTEYGTKQDAVTVEWLRGLTRHVDGYRTIETAFGVPFYSVVAVQTEETGRGFKLCVTFAKHLLERAKGTPAAKGVEVKTVFESDGDRGGDAPKPEKLHGNNAALVKARQMLGLTVEDMAVRLGMWAHSVRRIEAGEIVVAMQHVEKAEQMVREQQAKVKAAEDGLPPVLLVQDARATEGTGQDGEAPKGGFRAPPYVGPRVIEPVEMQVMLGTIARLRDEAKRHGFELAGLASDVRRLQVGLADLAGSLKGETL